MNDNNSDASRASADSSASSSDKKAQAEAFKNNARDEALLAAEKGLQAAREALEAAERKLAEAQRQAAYDRAQQAQRSEQDAVPTNFEDCGSARRDAYHQAHDPSSTASPGQAYSPGFDARANTAPNANAANSTAAYSASGAPADEAHFANGASAGYSSSWQGASQFSAQRPPVQPHYSAPYTTPKDHVAAGLLAIFLGCLGVHKFYLGYSTQGFIMLAISVLGGILSLGLVASIVWIVAIIEGIIYLSKSQSEFEQLYVYGKHEWF